MKIQTLWIVTQPTSVSELGDICFSCDMRTLQLQFAGGLVASDIVGTFTTKKEAVQLAKELLKG